MSTFEKPWFYLNKYTSLKTWIISAIDLNFQIKFFDERTLF
jgi:hypothetical protein